MLLALRTTGVYGHVKHCHIAHSGIFEIEDNAREKKTNVCAKKIAAGVRIRHCHIVEKCRNKKIMQTGIHMAECAKKIAAGVRIRHCHIVEKCRNKKIMQTGIHIESQQDIL
ncbi:hypothetical protein ACJX0J_015896 [Zea mays]